MTQLNNLIDLKLFYNLAIKETTNGKRIPRNFFQTYKSSLFDIKHSTQMKEFRVKHPTFNFYFYNDDDMDQFMNQFWRNHPIYNIYKGTKFGASKADIWRYCILFTLGGIYLDIDSQILFDMESIDENWNELISFEENVMAGFSWHYDWPCREFFQKHNFVENSLVCPNNIVLQWLMIFRPSHPILLRTINLIVENSQYYLNKEFDNVLHAVVSYSGPVIFSQAVWEYVQAGNPIQQTGYDFNRLAIFKSIPDPSQSSYLRDGNYYARQTKKIIYGA